MSAAIDASMGNDPYYQTSAEYYNTGRGGGGADYASAQDRMAQGGRGTYSALGSIVGYYWGPVGSAVGGLVGGVLDQKLGGSTTKTVRRDLSQSARDKIVYDVMSSDQGLAALASGENISGGYKSSTKGLMAQDLTAKTAGELARATTTEVTQEKKGTVICTELVRQGLLDKELYEAGHSHFIKLHPFTVRGYQSWAKPIATKMRVSKRLCQLTLPIARKRYLHVTGRRTSITGWVTVWIAQPICWVIGLALEVNDWGVEEFYHA